MILLGLGANLPGGERAPLETLQDALAALEAQGVVIERLSSWYESAPLPPSGQPWFTNGVAAVRTALAPGALLDLLHRIEDSFGRERGERNAARTLDLDLLDYDGLVQAGWPVLPHPRLHERAFVLRPLLDIAPDWRHPVSGTTARDLLASVGSEQLVRPLDFSG